MSKILITGGRGFLGTHLVAAVQAKGWTALAPARSELELADPKAIARYLDIETPDAILHAAATGGGIGWMKEHPETSLVGNILATTHILAAASSRTIPFVGVSSACVYPRLCPQPMQEEDIFEGEPEPTNGPYGHAKRLMLVQGRAAATEHGLRCAFVVPTNLYGPSDHFEPARSHIVAALLTRFLQAAEAQLSEVCCWGTGTATRDLLYVTDAATAILLALEKLPGPEPINLGTGIELTTCDIAHSIAQACDYTGTIRWDPTRPDGMPRKVLSTNRAKIRLGWEASTNLKTGLDETVAWYRQQS
jgi:GDP-L-fucose synthase